MGVGEPNFPHVLKSLESLPWLFVILGVIYRPDVYQNLDLLLGQCFNFFIYFSVFLTGHN